MKYQRKTLLLTASALAITAATHAFAADFNIPRGNLDAALDSFTKQSGITLMVPNDAVRGVRTNGVRGEYTVEKALASILNGTGFTASRDPSGIVAIVRGPKKISETSEPTTRLAEAVTPAHAAAAIETVVVTSSKIKGDIQTVPIAITALSQEQLTSRQIAGGPDLVKEVPNLTFSKTNFTGYNIEIRGIGTQAISVATDPAVAVAFNDMPFIRNHFFEQEFYDVSQVEVLRGPQGTLYGRNATAGVVNVVSAKPTDQFEAMASADVGNYHNRRYEGMINVPVVDDRLDMRLAAEWTKRDGYSFNELTNKPIDGRDLWSSRFTIGWKPWEKLQVYAIWEHFQENDDRIRSSKQLCKTDHGIPELLGQTTYGSAYLSQGCLPTSLYSPDAFGVVNGFSLPYFGGISGYGLFGALTSQVNPNTDPYASVTQSRNLRDIQSTLNPTYKSKNDTVELNADYAATPSLTFTSQTGFNHDFLWSTEDYNRFDTAPGIFLYAFLDPANKLVIPDGHYTCKLSGGYFDSPSDCSGGSYGSGNDPNIALPTGVFCDPQLGCSNRLVAEDLSDEHAWQLNQEFRLSSNFSGPFNFSAGANYLHYETEENYYVFINTITLVNANCVAHSWMPGVSDNSENLPNGQAFPDLSNPGNVTSCNGYIDPNPIGKLNNQGHNYFLSQNPYILNSYAGFGEAYYNVTKDLKLTGGLRWTDDEKHFIDIPSELLSNGYGYPVSRIVNQKWNQWTGRFAANWTPKLDFTDQTLVYGSFAHGYKAGGANPPGAEFPVVGAFGQHPIEPIHPLTFKPEFINAYELGTKNTLADGALTLNGDAFFYDYKGYQISRIVDRTAINDNFDAKVKGAELEAMWEPAPGLKINFAGGYEDTRIDNGQNSVDLMDRTAGNSNWVVLKPFPTSASNCIMPAYVVKYLFIEGGFQVPGSCSNAYDYAWDPLTDASYAPYPGVSTNGTPIPDYPGFDPLAGTPGDPYTGQNTYDGIDYGPAPNNGQGFSKNVGGNELPNAPHFTTSLSAEYTIPVSEDWAATLHSDFYWQSQSWARVFNDRPYDKLRGYSNVNLALILTSASGWQVMGYLKNVFNTTAITGDFLNSDDTGLTTNVFLTDPRLFGVRVTKNW